MAIEMLKREMELRYPLKVKLEACDNEFTVGGVRKRSVRDDPMASYLSHHWRTMVPLSMMKKTEEGQVEEERSVFDVSIEVPARCPNGCVE